LISVPCGFAYGLTWKSNAEQVKAYHDNKHATGFKVFTRTVVSLIIMLGMFFVPSIILLKLFNLFPLHGYYIAWVFSMFGGAIIGKIFRWWRWSKTCDFG
jgi:hypothetical protein